MRKPFLLLVLLFTMMVSYGQIHKYAPAHRATSRAVLGECEYRTIKVFNKDTSVLSYVLIDLISPAKDLEGYIMNKQLPAGSYEVRMTTIVGKCQRWFTATVTPVSVKISP